MICDRCYKDAFTGYHGLGICPMEPRRATAIKPDTILGGFVAENAWRTPRFFDSQKKYERALDESGLAIKPPKSRGASPVSRETLEWAARRLGARSKTVEITETALDETVTVQADL